MASGIVIGLLGLWILLRTISSGTSGQNLADFLLNLGGPAKSSTGTPTGTGTPATPRNSQGQPAPAGTGARPQGRNVQGGARS